MYLITITAGLCVEYFGVMFLYPFMFSLNQPQISEKRSVVSLIGIVLLSAVGYGISFSITDPDLRNRFLHGFGGGFVAFFVSFLSVKDARISVSRFRFFILSFLVVTALGVLNEIVECVLQMLTGVVYAPTVTDTWFDLISNTVGIFLAGVCFTPLIARRIT